MLHNKPWNKKDGVKRSMCNSSFTWSAVCVKIPFSEMQNIVVNSLGPVMSTCQASLSSSPEWGHLKLSKDYSYNQSKFS